MARDRAPRQGDRRPGARAGAAARDLPGVRRASRELVRPRCRDGRATRVGRLGARPRRPLVGRELDGDPRGVSCPVAEPERPCSTCDRERTERGVPRDGVPGQRGRSRGARQGEGAKRARRERRHGSLRGTRAVPAGRHRGRRRAPSRGVRRRRVVRRHAEHQLHERLLLPLRLLRVLQGEARREPARARLPGAAPRRSSGAAARPGNAARSRSACRAASIPGSPATTTRASARRSRATSPTCTSTPSRRSRSGRGRRRSASRSTRT